MPCNSGYLAPTSLELSISKVLRFHEELNGAAANHSDGGLHPRARRVTRERADQLVASLCERIKTIDVSKYSLEMQIWWRDHQAADAARLKAEELKRKEDAEVEAALDKLTDREVSLLRSRKRF